MKQETSKTTGFKRIGSLLLAVVMLLSLMQGVPLSAFAEDVTAAEETSEPIAPAAEETEDPAEDCEHIAGAAQNSGKTRAFTDEDGRIHCPTHVETVYCRLCGRVMSERTVCDHTPGAAELVQDSGSLNYCRVVRCTVCGAELRREPYFTLTENGSEAEQTQPEVVTEGEKEYYADSAAVGDATVAICADVGVFPEGSTLTAEEVSEETAEQVLSAVKQTAATPAEDAEAEDAETEDEAKTEDEAETEEQIPEDADVYIFSVSVLNAEGEPVQPDTTAGKVRLSFTMPEKLGNTVRVFHINPVTLEADELTAEAADEYTVTAETTEFSYFAAVSFDAPEQLPEPELSNASITTCYWEILDSGTMYLSPVQHVSDSDVDRDLTNAWDMTGNAPWGTRKNDILKLIVYDNGTDKLAVSSVTGWFNELPRCTYIDVAGLDTSVVTDMSNMFSRDTAAATITGLTELNTSNVTTMADMFQIAQLQLPLMSAALTHQM